MEAYTLLADVLRLSAAAEAAISALAAAKDDRAQGEAWRAVQGDKQVAGELRAFGAAVEQRFGEEACASCCGPGDGRAQSQQRRSRPSSGRRWNGWPR